MTDEKEETDAKEAHNQISFLLSAQLLVDFLDTFSDPNHQPMLLPLTDATVVFKVSCLSLD